VIDDATGESLIDAIVTATYPDKPSISPDGRWVAWANTPLGRDGDHAVGDIWVAPMDGSRQGRRFTSGEWQDSSPAWSPDNDSIAFLSDRAERGTTGLYLISLDGGEAQELVKRKSAIQAFAWSPDGTSIAFTSADEPTEDDERRKSERDDPEVYGENWPYARLRILDIDSGEIRTIPTGDRHIYELAWSPDGERLALLTSPTPELETRWRSQFEIADPAKESIEVVLGETGMMPENLKWTRDGRRLCFSGTHEAGISGGTHYRVESTGGQPVKIGPSESESVCSNGAINVRGDDRLVLYVADGLRSRLEWVDPETGKREALYAPDHGGFSPSFDVHATASGRPRIAVITSSGDQPPALHVGTPGDLTLVSDHHADLSQYTYGNHEPFHWTAPDGLEIDGVLIRPVDAGEGPYPLLVHIHGGPYGRDTLGWSLRAGHWAHWMAMHGYAVLLPNYRGGMGRGNAFAKWADGGVGDMEFADIMSGVDAAIERGIADPDRLGIGGWSQGGFLTAWAVTQTNRFKAGVMGAGVSDWGMMVMTSDVPTGESMLGGGKPWDGPGPHRFMQHSPISHARNVETPLLILHGKNDERVPVSQAIGFHRAIQENDVETELVIYPREPHGIRERHHQRDMLRRVRDWFLAHV
jgi:dipeptidyl aminopeptidase/acylaminoacyl peptidase